MKTHAFMNRLFVALVLLGWSAVAANAQTVINQGECGENLRWTLTGDSTLTISGSGEMADYDDDIWTNRPFAPWRQYQATVTRIVLDDGVTEIGDYAFCNFSKLTSVDLSNIVKIGNRAFYYSSVATVRFSNSLTEIGEWAFYWTKLTTLTIPENVTKIGNGAFSYNNELQTVNYNAINCSTGSFSGAKLTTVNIGERVKIIPNSFLIGNTALTTVNMNDSVTSIGLRAFDGCSALTAINIPDGVTSIEESTFRGCAALTSVTIPDGVTNIGYSAFNGSGISSISVSENVAAIGLYAFAGCPNLETVNYNAIDATTPSSNSPFQGSNIITVNIGGKVKTICRFAEITTLKNVNISVTDSLTTIPQGAFFGCTGLTSFTIPKNVKSVGARAFENCTGLETLNYNAENINSLPNAAFKNCTAFTTLNIGSEVVNIPYSGFAYATIATVNMGENVETIGQSAFYGIGITSITIPEKVTWIMSSAFNNCTKLETVNYNAVNCQEMDNVFQGCTKFTTLNIGSKVESIARNAFRNGNAYSTLANINFAEDGVLATIGNSAFRGCALAGEVILPHSVQTIAEYAFNAGKYISVTIPENVRSIGSSAFGQCANLATVNFNAINCETSNSFDGNEQFATLNIGNRVKRVSDQAFYFCDALVSISIGDSVETIGSEAFRSCGMASITIPESVKSISGGAFDDCPNLTSAYFNAVNCTTNYYPLFEDCALFTGLRIGDGVKTIPDYAFSNNGTLTNVVFGESLETVGKQAFYNCNKLSAIDFPNSLTQIGEYAFNGCTEIESIITRAITPPVLEYGAFYSISRDVPVYIPCLTRDAYSKGVNDSGWWSYYFDHFFINGPASDTTYYEVTKCYGAPYSDDNFPESIYSAGNYFITLENSSLCDSVVCLALSEYPYVPETFYQVSFCEGGSYSDENFTNITTAGHHSLTLQNVNGCDSTVSVYLSITPAPVHEYSATVCEGSAYSDENFTALTEAGIHKLTLKTAGGCDSIVSLNLSYAVSPPQELCMISVDMAYHNQIVWKRQEEVTAYNIYREGNVTGQYELATTVPYEETNSWIDPQSNARVRSYSYKIAGVDTCGNESAVSEAHKTMHLTINRGMGSWNLIWTPYEGTGYATYNIYRAMGETFNGELELVGTIPSSLTSFTDFVSTGSAYVYYMVEIVLDEACEVAPAASMRLKAQSETWSATIRSNIATNNPNSELSGLEAMNAGSAIRLYPNPAKDKLIVESGELLIENEMAQIIDLSGKTVIQSQISTFNSPLTINVSALRQGVYFLKIKTVKGIVTEKFMKE